MSGSDTRVARLLKAIATRRRSMRPPMSQEAVAYAAGVSVRHYQKIESGNGDPRLSTLLSVCEALDTSLQTLLDKAKLT